MAAPSVLPDAASRKGAVDPRGVLLFLGAAVVAFLLYRPDTDAPFEIIDFSETLPFLTEGRDFGERFSGLVGYYLQHGRAAFALSAGLAAKWTLFEWWTPGWQWVRYGVGLGVVIGAWLLLRTLGANRLGASVGASLFLVSETVAPGWLRPSVNEPFGTLLLLTASLLACRYQAVERPKRLALVIAALLASMIIVKETLVAATFFPVVVALCRRPDGVFAAPAFSARNRVLVMSCASAIMIAAIPVIWALTQSAPGGYARQFGATGSLVSNAVFGVLPAVVPFTPVSQPPGWATTVADIAWLLLLISVLRGARNEGAKAHQRILLGAALAVPLARLLVYLPWPLQFPYYSIPFLIGVAVIAATGTTKLSVQGGVLRVVAVAAAAVVIVYSASVSFGHASRYFALRRLTDAWVTALYDVSRNRSLTEIIVAVPMAKEQAWTGLGPTLSRYAAATGRPFPAVREVSCGDAGRMVDSIRATTVLTALRHHCPLRIEAPPGPLVVARRLDASRFRAVADSLRAQIVVAGS
jgi:hypothetical protein